MDDAVKVEFQRIHDEDERQNHRLNELETTVKQLNDIVLSIQRLTISVESLTKEVKRQGQRLETIEQAPVERINGVRQTIINTVTGIVIGALAVGLINIIATNI